MEYFTQIFRTNIVELKVMATELVLTMTFDLKFILIKYPENAKDYISIFTLALTLQPSVIIIRAIQGLDHIISSSSLMNDELMSLLDHISADLVQNLVNLLTHLKSKSYFEKSSFKLET